MGLSKKAKMACEIMAANPFLKDKEIAEQVQISATQFCLWKRKPEFQEYWDECLRREWKGYSKKCQKLMWDLAENGDRLAVQYILDSCGYKPKEEVAIESEGLNIHVSIDDGNG